MRGRWVKITKTQLTGSLFIGSYLTSRESPCAMQTVHRPSAACYGTSSAPPSAARSHARVPYPRPLYARRRPRPGASTCARHCARRPASNSQYFTISAPADRGHSPLALCEALEEWVKLFRKTFKFMGPEIANEFLMSTGYLPIPHDPGCWLEKK